MPQGRLRIYFGVAPGVGATHAMLDEGRRRRARRADVVIGSADLHGRPRSSKLATGLGGSAHPGRSVSTRTRSSRAARRSSWSTNSPASRTRPNRRGRDGPPSGGAGRGDRRRRHGRRPGRARSLREKLTTVMGERPTHTLPDAQLLSADQIELVDMTPAALRRRLAHGGSTHPGRSMHSDRRASSRAPWPRCASSRCGGRHDGSGPARGVARRLGHDPAPVDAQRHSRRPPGLTAGGSPARPGCDSHGGYAGDGVARRPRLLRTLPQLSPGRSAAVPTGCARRPRRPGRHTTR